MDPDFEVEEIQGKKADRIHLQGHKGPREVSYQVPPPALTAHLFGAVNPTGL